LQDQQSLLQQKIYTLRIHKYSYKLYRQIIKGKNNRLPEEQIKFIHVSSDPNQFDSGEKPDARLQFVCESNSDFEEEFLEDAIEQMFSGKKGSGSYYGVEFHPEFVTLSEYLANLEASSPELIADDVHVYQGGNHYWAESTLSLDELIAQLTDEGWMKYWSKSWPPLISNLKIQVNNPLEEQREEPSGTQAGLEWFE
jgi:hypothetical protein